jgi:Fe-S oxidoreductase
MESMLNDVEDETELGDADAAAAADDCCGGGGGVDYGSLDRDIQAQRVVALEVSAPSELLLEWRRIL